MHRLIFFSLCIMLSISSFADPRIYSSSYPAGNLQFTNKNGVYTYEVDLGDKVNIELDKPFIKIQRQEIYQGAISNDGPWWDIENASSSSAWHTINKPITENGISQFSSIQITNYKNWKLPNNLNLDVKKMLLQCKKNKLINEISSPCYIYLSKVRYKIWFKNERKPQELILYFSGGC